MSRDWSRLTELLEARLDQTVTVAIDDIEAVVGPLPDASRTTAGYWADTATHGFAWTQCNRSVSPRLIDREIDFSHVGPPPIAVVPSDKVETVLMPIELRILEKGALDLTTDGRPNLEAHALIGPGVYAFTCRRSDGSIVCYVGESENLHVRMSQYEAAATDNANKTDRKVHKEIVDCVESGGGADLDVVFEVVADGEVLALDRASARRLVENAVLVRLRRQGVVCLNVDDLFLEDTD